jgi:hypothetical protein
LRPCLIYTLILSGQSADQPGTIDVR